MFRKNCKDTSSTLPLQDASSDISTYGYIWPFKVELSSSEKVCYIGFNENSLKMMIMNCFCGMVDQRKAFSLITAGTIVRDPYHCESSPSPSVTILTIASRIWTCTEPEFRLCWMKRCAVLITFTPRRWKCFLLHLKSYFRFQDI